MTTAMAQSLDSDALYVYASTPLLQPTNQPTNQPPKKRRKKEKKDSRIISRRWMVLGSVKITTRVCATMAIVKRRHAH